MLKYTKKLLLFILCTSILLTTAHDSVYADINTDVLYLINRDYLMEKPANANDIISVEEYLVILAKAFFDPVDIRREGFDELNKIFIDYNKLSKESLPYIMQLYEEGVFNSNIYKGSKLRGTGLLKRQSAYNLLNQVFVKDKAEFLCMFLLIDILLNNKVITDFADGIAVPKGYVSYSETANWLRAGIAYNKSMNVSSMLGTGFLGNISGNADETSFALPLGITINKNRKIITLDTYNAEIKSINTKNSTTMIANSGMLDDYGFAKGMYKDSGINEALFNRPVDGVFNSNNELIILDAGNHNIRIIKDNNVTTIAGGSIGYVDGIGKAAKFNTPSGICIDKNNNLYIADSGNNCIRMIDESGNTTTIAGLSRRIGYKDGTTAEAVFNEPSGIAVTDDGTIYVVDTGNQVIRMIKEGIVTTIAGICKKENKRDEYAIPGYVDGSVNKAQFNFPKRLIIVNDILIISDTGNHAIRAIYNDEVYTIAGNGEVGDTLGRSDMAMFNKPTGICYINGRLYLCDSYNNKIKSIRFNPKSLRLEKES